MNKSIIKLKLLAIFFFTVGSLVAQKQTKVSQSINVDKDVTIDLNTSHCNLIFDTWNKDVVEIEACIEGEDLSEEELKEAVKHWQLDVNATKTEVKISSGAGTLHRSTYVVDSDLADVNTILKELKLEIADLPEIKFAQKIVIPELPEMPELPELPELPKNVESINFDYEAYQKDGEKYLNEYQKRVDKVFGEDYAKKMEAWGKKFGELWEEKYGKKMEEWAKKFEEKWDSEEFEKKMEAWGVRFAEQMEQQAENLEERKEALEKAAEERNKAIKEQQKSVNKRRVYVKKITNKGVSPKVIKTIRIKMPKKAKLKVNVKHGEVEFASTVDNLKADLAYTKFIANSINGSLTSINASYSPVFVTHWNLGELNLKYTKQVELNHVKHLVLNSSSSNITIDNLLGNVIIDSNIGDINVRNLSDSFTNLNVIVQNCDAKIALPKTNYSLQYKGDRSRFSHPNKAQGNVATFSTGDFSSGKSIVVNAKYSNITMK